MQETGPLTEGTRATVPGRTRRGPGKRSAPPTAVRPGPGSEPPDVLRPPPPSGSSEDPLVGKTIGGCEIVKVLGRGAMGTVYKARQLSIDRTVALKTIRPDLCADRHFLSRFRQEARTVGRFNNEYVVQIYEVGLDQGFHYIIMEYVGGGTLREHAGKQHGKRLSSRDAFKFLLESSRGLLEAERLGVVHRDIKPGNLLLDSRGRVKIADFGIAKMLEADVQSTLTSGLGVLGTPLYMSPEQASGAKLDHRSDMYALGATFYQLLTAAPPVEGQSVYEVIKRKSVTEHLSPRRIVPGEGIPENLSQLIERMTALKPEDRYASFQDLVEDIERARSGESLGELVKRPVEDLSTGRSLRVWVGVAAALLIVALVGYFAFGGFRAKPTPGPGGGSVSVGPKGTVDGTKPDGREPIGSGKEATKSSGGSGVTPPPDSVVSGGGSVDVGTVGGTSTSGKEMRIPPVPVPLGDYQGRVRQLRSRFAEEGPTDVLLADAQRLLGDLPRVAEAGELRGESEALLNDIGEGKRRQSALLTRPLDTRTVKPPFDETVAYWRGLEEVFRPPTTSGEELGSWLEAERVRRAAALGVKLDPEVRALAERAREEARRLGDWEIAVVTFRPLVVEVEKSRQNILQLFPGETEKWNELLPESLPQDLEGKASRHSESEASLASLESRIGDAERFVAGLPSSADSWSSGVERRVEDSVQGARKVLETVKPELTTFGNENPKAPLEDAKARLEKLETTAGEWERNLELWRGALAKLKDRDLAGLETALADLRKTGFAARAVERLAETRTALVEGFRQLVRDADTADARKNLESARSLLEGLDGTGDVTGYVEGCLARLVALETLSRDMAPVRGGEVLIPEKSSSRRLTVQSFFLDRQEVSVEEYGKFVDAFKDVSGYEACKDLWPDARTFDRYGHGQFLVPRYLAEIRNPNPKWPIEDVNYYQAQAYLRWKKKDLPTVAEWFLAARGPLAGGSHPYDVPSVDVHQNPERPAPVDQGSLARGFPARYPVHHVAGNVAEWCRAEEGDTTAQLLGGRFLDRDKRYFSGERRDTLPLSESGRGYGFRGVVRPADFFRDLLPRE